MNEGFFWFVSCRVRKELDFLGVLNIAKLVVGYLYEYVLFVNFW